MNTRTPIRDLIRPPLTGRHVLILMISFFAVIFAVNGVFVYVSLQSHPGVTSENAYREGLRFNSELDRAGRQKARGWTSQLVFDDKELVVRMRDASGTPLTGLAVEVLAQRPVHDRADMKMTLREATPGEYWADARQLVAGRWNLTVIAARGGALPHRADYSVQVKQ